MERPRSIFWPLLLITTGLIWLLVRSGNLPAANLWALTHVWPYALILAGVGLILRPYWRYTTVFLDVVVIAGAVLAIYNAPRLGWANPNLMFTFGDGDFYVGPTERGSGTMKTETREVAAFESIEVSYPAEVLISQGATESVKVEAEDNLLPGLKTEVRDGRLRIYYQSVDGKHVNPTRTAHITIVVRDLSAVDFESAGQLVLDGIETPSLEVSISGAGGLELKQIATDELTVDLSGAGSMEASGEAGALRVDISGLGSFDAPELHSVTAEISLSGAGSATVWVDEQLDAQISGAGSIDYYGSPSVSKQISGVGSVNSRGKK